MAAVEMEALKKQKQGSPEAVFNEPHDGVSTSNNLQVKLISAKRLQSISN